MVSIITCVVVRMGMIVSGWVCPYGKLSYFPDCVISMIHCHMTQTCPGMLAVRTPVIGQVGLSPRGFIASGGEILP